MNICEMATYIYIDVSNIRAACLKSCGFRIDFTKLMKYFQRKYPNLKEARYYEGISINDLEKQKYFDFLEDQVGYKVCRLIRKSYVQPAYYKTYFCTKCGARNKVQIAPNIVKMKSNVDVYLASDMIKCVAEVNYSLHLILVSCDGDYAEAIDTILSLNSDVFITILATPMKRKNNYLSKRLQKFADSKFKNITLINIETIKDYIKN